MGNNGGIIKAPQIASLALTITVKTDVCKTAFSHGHILFKLEAEYSRDTGLDDKSN